MTMEIFTRENTEFLFFALEQTKGITQRDDFHPEKEVLTAYENPTKSE